MGEIQLLYSQFLAVFPGLVRPFISIALAIFLIYSVFQAIKKNFIYLIVVVVLLPATIPILKGVFDALVMAIKFLLNTK